MVDTYLYSPHLHFQSRSTIWPSATLADHTYSPHWLAEESGHSDDSAKARSTFRRGRRGGHIGVRFRPLELPIRNARQESSLGFFYHVPFLLVQRPRHHHRRDLFDEFKKAFLDGLDSGATMDVSKPSCTGEDQARMGGYSVTSSTTDAVYWCFGMSGSNRVLKVVNDRRYPMEVALPHSVLQGGSIDWAQLSSLSFRISGRDKARSSHPVIKSRIRSTFPHQVKAAFRHRWTD